MWIIPSYIPDPRGATSAFRWTSLSLQTTYSKICSRVDGYGNDGDGEAPVQCNLWFALLYIIYASVKVLYQSFTLGPFSFLVTSSELLNLKNILL